MSTTQEPQKFTKFGQAFISYGSYHYDFTNKVIHIICIPLIAATLFSLLSFIPFDLTIENIPVLGTFTLGCAEAFGLLVFSYYFSLNPFFGVLAGFFMIITSILWKSCFDSYSTEEMFKVVLIIQIVAWALQFIGHGVFQKRKPALLDNVTQILNAPMFVLIELCELFGLKNQEIESWKVEIQKNVQQFRKASKKTN